MNYLNAFVPSAGQGWCKFTERKTETNISQETIRSAVLTGRMLSVVIKQERKSTHFPFTEPFSMYITRIQYF